MNEVLIMKTYQRVNYVIKHKSDPGIDKKKKLKSMPSHIGIFVLSHSKRIVKKFVHEKSGFYSNKVYYQDTDSLYMHMDQYQKLKDAGYVGNKLRQRKNDYGDGGIFNGLCHVVKRNLCYTIAKYGPLNEKKIFKGYHDTERLLETYKFFKLNDGETVIGEFRNPWKRSLGRGRTIDKKEYTF